MSLLTRKEEKRNLRKSFLYGFLTILLGIAIFFLGVPALIKLAVFVGKINRSSTPPEQTDNVPPSPPVFEPAFEATNSATISLSGFAESESTLKLFFNNEEKEVLVDNSGTFIFNDLKLKEGQNRIYAVAIDKVGNESSDSKRVSVLYDNEAPELEINQPQDGETITDDNNKIEIVGQTEEGTDVLVNDHFVVVDSEGNFNYQISLDKGENEIKVLTEDSAGNQTEKIVKINYSP